MFSGSHTVTSRDRTDAFTLIELLTVIAIMTMVTALAVPGFVAMMKSQKWTSTIGTVQNMIMRGRSLATNLRTDMAVEFDITDDEGTFVWLESEVNDIERIPDLETLQLQAGGLEAISDFLDTFHDSGGRWRQGALRYESQCRVLSCLNRWTSYSEREAKRCPECGATGWQYGPYYFTMRFDITYDPSLARTESRADNVRQSEVVPLPHGITVDARRCKWFYNWDDVDSVEAYGGDGEIEVDGRSFKADRDIRLGPNGALVQTQDPVICFATENLDDRRAVKVVRCTGRLIRTDVPSETQSD